MQKYFPFKRLNHREILLYGFHFNFLLIFTLAVFRDLYFDNYFNASVNFSALFISGVSYYFLHFKKMTNLASNLIVVIAVVPLYILIYFNHFGNMVIIYVIFLPLAAFFLLEFKKAIVVNFLIYVLLIGMLIHISNVDPQAPILNNLFALINIVMASILILVFGIFYHLAIDISLTDLILSNRQKDILLKEVHHRVKNNLNVIASMLGLQAMGKNDETKEELSISKSRIESIAIVHEMLYKQDNFDNIIFNDYVLKLKNLILSMHEQDSRIKVNIKENEQLSLELSVMIQFGLIINEMLTNSLKYATNEQGLKIFISLEKSSQGFSFTYKDNGEKILSKESIASSSGLGFKLVELSVKQLDGSIQTEYADGLQHKIVF
ncbi:MAG: sensor histidine kinase [Campylobacterota bacterium]|nr:sensor histidine kinase [Campylobacterota bacterium]